MKQSINLTLAVILVAAVAVPAIATDIVSVENRVDYIELSNDWTQSLMSFVEVDRDLSLKQREALDDAIQFGTPELFKPSRERSLRKIVGELEAVFSRDEAGQIFGGMATTQAHLAAQRIIAVPYCNCVTLDADCPGPLPGDCQTGCLSYTGDNGTNYVGVCSVVQDAVSISVNN